MTKAKVEVEQPEAPKQRTLQDLSEIELKALAFEKSEQIKQLQREYNTVYEELVRRHNMSNMSKQ